VQTIELSKSEDFRLKSNLWFLAKTTGTTISTSSTYILFLTKLQKKANPVKWICPSWKTISQYFWTPDIYAFIADIQDWIIKKRQAISDPAPNHNEHTDELDLC